MDAVGEPQGKPASKERDGGGSKVRQGEGHRKREREGKYLGDMEAGCRREKSSEDFGLRSS